MPQVPRDVPGLDVHGWYRPAERTTGDFYDFVRTRDGRLAVVVGDVTGHGIGPALITATAQASLRSYLRVLDDLPQVVTMLNQDLAERIDDGRFLTLFVAIFGGDGSAQVLNAGHSPPLVWRCRTRRVERLPSHGPALGFIADHRYAESSRIALEDGDVLLAFSDGLVESRAVAAPDRKYQESGVERVLERLAGDCSARELTERLVEDALAFAAGNREDDITIVAVRKFAAASVPAA
jgi:serine phosphatase RsbU (regulator of sigma subunit)